MKITKNCFSGVFQDDGDTDLYIDVSRVAELTSFTFNNNVLTLGANTSLTNTMLIFESLSKSTGFKYLSQMRDHLDLVATVPARNVSITNITR